MPTQEVDGVKLTRWASKEHWVNMLVAGRVDCPRLDPVCARVRERILQAVRRAASPEEDELMAVARAGREALALKDDSDSDADSDKKEKRDKKKKKKKKKTKKGKKKDGARKRKGPASPESQKKKKRQSQSDTDSSDSSPASSS